VKTLKILVLRDLASEKNVHDVVTELRYTHALCAEKP
jgi:hypothetical protein